MLRRGRGRTDGTRASAAAHGRLAGGCYSLRRRWLPQKRSAQLGQRMGPTSSLWFFHLCSTSYEEDWCPMHHPMGHSDHWEISTSLP